MTEFLTALQLEPFRQRGHITPVRVIPTAQPLQLGDFDPSFVALPPVIAGQNAKIFHEDANLQRYNIPMVRC